MTEPQRNRTLARELELLTLIASGLPNGRVEIRRSDAGIVSVELAGEQPATILGLGSSTPEAVRNCVDAMHAAVGESAGDNGSG